MATPVPTFDAMAAAPPGVRTVDALLATCPSAAEMAQVRRDVNIYFDPSVPASALAWSCTPGGAESSALLTLYNALRAMRLVTFDAPLPLVGATNLYDWFRALGLGIRIVAGPAPETVGDHVTIPMSLLSQPELRSWLDPRSGTGLMDIVALLVHEGRHTLAGGGVVHDCGPWDSSLAYGGAWALEYWYYRWLAEHAPGYLSAAEQQGAANTAALLASRVFCDAQRGATERQAPPPATKPLGAPAFSLPVVWPPLVAPAPPVKVAPPPSAVAFPRAVSPRAKSAPAGQAVVTPQTAAPARRGALGAIALAALLVGVAAALASASAVRNEGAD